MAPNNIFNFATSELSQDAFICWIINWINHRDSDQLLYETAKLFLDSLFGKAGITKPENYKSVEIKQQFEKVDVLVIINDRYVIIIEDKVSSENHSDQLNRYRVAVERRKGQSVIPKNYELLTIYFKTGNQSRFDDVKSKGYTPYLRRDFLDVMGKNAPNISNAIFQDYLEYLQNIENQTNSYLSTAINKWNWWAWEGFFMDVFEYITKGKPKQWESWEYKNNARGGNWALYWNWIELKDLKAWIYLQLELEMGYDARRWICLKVWVENKEDRSSIRNRLFEMTQDLGHFDPVVNSPHFHSGEYMTFWIQSKSVFEDCNSPPAMTDVYQIVDQTTDLLKKLVANVSKS